MIPLIIVAPPGFDADGVGTPAAAATALNGTGRLAVGRGKASADPTAAVTELAGGTSRKVTGAS